MSPLPKSKIQNCDVFSQYASVENVLPQLNQWALSGQRVCLATLVYADGSAPRPRGSQMAVAEDGSWYGYLSGGCAEAAIAAEACAAINEGRSRAVRYGVGSPYLDIQLPCGAGIDIWFDQSIDAGTAERLLNRIDARCVTGIETSTLPAAAMSRVIDTNAKSIAASSFRRWYFPQRRLYVIGAGPGVAALSALASAADYSVRVLSPDRQTLEGISHQSVNVELLQSQSQIDTLVCDPWTAVVLFFHEHERETAILKFFLGTEVYYVGALGSCRTHRARLELLRSNGVTQEDCERIHGPVGLDIDAQTPAEIAISVLAELTQSYQRVAPALLDWDEGHLATRFVV